MARKYDFEAPVMVGNVYTSSDPRTGNAPDRLGADIKIVNITTEHHFGSDGTVKAVKVAECVRIANNRRTTVRVDRLRPTRSGYRLVRRGDGAVL